MRKKTPARDSRRGAGGAVRPITESPGQRPPPCPLRTGITFSRDPKNVAGLHSFKHSGLAQARAIGVVTVDAKTKKTKTRKAKDTTRVALVFSTKTPNKPAKATQRNVLSRNPTRAEKSIRTLVEGSAGKSGWYRRDLLTGALQRYTALSKAAATPAPTEIHAGRSRVVTL